MDLIQMTRELGKALQADERYIKMRLAQQHNDEDEALQELIQAFNLKRAQINAEIEKDNRDEETLQVLNREFRGIYGEIMANDSMMAYNEAKQDFDVLLKQITAIIGLCADGEDPDTCDYEAACSGDCSTCGGCG